jgi:hypothetical protein
MNKREFLEELIYEVRIMKQAVAEFEDIDDIIYEVTEKMKDIKEE